MENIDDLRYEYIFKNYRGWFVVIDGEIYEKEHKYYYSKTPENTVFLPKTKYKGLSILDEKDQETFYQIINKDSFVDGMMCHYRDYLRKDRFDISYDEYKLIIKDILENLHKQYKIKEYEKELSYWFEPVHIIRSTEVEDGYYCYTTAVLNGREISGLWDDGEHPLPLFSEAPGYIIVDDEINTDNIPSKEKIHVEGGHPKDGLWRLAKLIPKKYLDKIFILVTHTDFSGEIRVKQERLELDFNNPDLNVLEFMLKHQSICEKSKKCVHK